MALSIDNKDELIADVTSGVGETSDSKEPVVVTVAHVVVVEQSSVVAAAGNSVVVAGSGQ